MTRLSSRCLWDICFLEIYLQQTTVFVKGLSVPISDITTETRCSANGLYFAVNSQESNIA